MLLIGASSWPPYALSLLRCSHSQRKSARLVNRVVPLSTFLLLPFVCQVWRRTAPTWTAKVSVSLANSLLLHPSLRATALPALSRPMHSRYQVVYLSPRLCPNHPLTSRLYLLGSVARGWAHRGREEGVGGGGAGDEGRPFCVVTEQRAKHCDSQRLLLCGHRLVLGGTVPMFRLVEHIGVHWCVCVCRARGKKKITTQHDTNKQKN